MEKLIQKLKEAAAAKKTKKAAMPVIPKIDLEKLKKVAEAKNMKSAAVDDKAAAKFKEIVKNAKQTAADKRTAEHTDAETEV